MFHYFGRSGWSNIDIRSNVWPTVGLYGVPLTLHSFGTAALPLQSLTLSKNWHPCQFLDMRGCLKSWLLFQHPREFKIKSLYSNDLILNIASKSKETVQKLKFLDSSIITAWNHGHPCPFCGWHPCQTVNASFGYAETSLLIHSTDLHVGTECMSCTSLSVWRLTSMSNVLP